MPANMVRRTPLRIIARKARSYKKIMHQHGVKRWVAVPLGPEAGCATFPQKRGRCLDYIIIGLMVLAIGLFEFDRFMPVGAGLAREHGGQDAA